MIINTNDTNYKEITERINSYVKPRGLSAHVMTFGCQQNEADSEKIRGMLIDMGYTLSENYNECSIIIVNTCAIRAHAEMKALSILGNFKAVKRKNPELIVGVVGCMAAEVGICNRLKSDFHYVSFTAEPNMLHKIPELVLSSLQENKRSFLIGEDKGDIQEGLPILRTGGHKAWVSVMYGCNNFCSYCIVPYVRGRERSRESAVIIGECRELVRDGIKEITLLGQNVNSYKSDISFAELLESIANIEGDFIIRFMTSHPKDASDELIDVMRRHTGKIAPFFHLPLQSGSDRILSRMNRTYNSEHYLALVKKLREAIPDIVLSTDVIIGFPGESDGDFEDTMKILRTVRFDVVYSFLYSKREGTRAALMADAVGDEVKSERMKRLLALQDAVSYEKNLAYEGRRVRVLVDSLSKKNKENTYTARTYGNKLVHFTAETVKIGEFAEVIIEKAGAYDLFGKLI